MKQTIEIDVPDGWEVNDSDKNLFIYGEDAHIAVRLTKKQVKDFSFYVDEYLHIYPTTNNEMVNWLEDEQVETMRSRLKQNKFSLVPWEIKIGLFKFICDSEKVNYLSALERGFPCELDGKIIISQEFMRELKQNKN